MGRSTACVDQMSGEVSYRKLKIAVLLLANAIAKLPGKHIGIMLPACTAVNIAAIACMIAKKVPVMINWTLGPSTLKSTIDQSKIERTLSSWNFLNHLDNAELNGLDNQFILLEDMKRQMTWKDKIKALWLSLKNTNKILRAFHADMINEEDPAVILFTSGTESTPKGVPLSHKNLIVNQKDALDLITINNDDIFLSTLPPFHSFGFSVTGLLPLMAGLRVVYSPNPTDGRKLAALIEKRGVTLLCLAPTFLKNIIRTATASQLKSLRLVVTGAEKTPHEVYEKMRLLTPTAYVIEGYGITECAPILSLNIPEKPLKGVGFPLPHVKFKIVHPETFESLPLETQGLVLASGPNIFKGYLDASLPSPFVELEETKWYVTGDLGSLDQEGYLTLSGRLKRFTKIGGEMISLNAIEEVLHTAAKTQQWPIDPDQPSLAVVALEEEGRKTEICLFTTFDVTLEEVNHLLRESGMSNLIRIRSIKKLSYIPLLGTGKVDYRALIAKLS